MVSRNGNAQLHKGWLPVNSRAWCLVWQAGRQAGGQAGGQATHCWKGWTQWLLEKLCIETHVWWGWCWQKAVWEGIVWHFSAQDMRVQWERGKESVTLCLRATMSAEDCLVCLPVRGLIFYACMFFLVRVSMFLNKTGGGGAKKKRAKATCATLPVTLALKHDI